MRLIHGDSLDKLKLMDADSVDSLVTDPPAGISFMGKEWDAEATFHKQMHKIFTECFRVLKPGAHGLVWALPRASHHTASALEVSGFEIRDVITHHFGCGFPKSLAVGKAIDKHLCVKREVVGIESLRTDMRNASFLKIARGEREPNIRDVTVDTSPEAKKWQGFGTALKPASEHWILVRKPLSEKTIAANVLKHGTGGLNIDASRIGVDSLDKTKTGRWPSNLILSHSNGCASVCEPGCPVAEIGEPSRFFYCAKSSKRERNEGCETNHHPTVKSIRLMSYLIKLVTPPQGTVLDPFMGSGSTGVAAIKNGFDFIGIERELEYFAIAHARIKHHMSDLCV